LSINYTRNPLFTSSNIFIAQIIGSCQTSWMASIIFHLYFYLGLNILIHISLILNFWIKWSEFSLPIQKERLILLLTLKDPAFFGIFNPRHHFTFDSESLKNIKGSDFSLLF
jgi:hypothetical protein